MEDPRATEARKQLVADTAKRAAAHDAEQAQRAREFEDQVRHTFRKTRIPITREWLEKRKEGWMHSTCVPGRILPWMLFGANYEHSPGYVPIERRFTYRQS